MKKFIWLVISIIMVSVLLVGCTQPTAAPTTAPAETTAAPTTAPVETTAAPTKTEKEILMEGAKAEGQVVSYGMSDDWVNLGNIWKSIEDKYNVIHTDTDMTSAEQITRLLAEKDAPVMDVADIGFDFLGTLVENNLPLEYRNSYWEQIPADRKDANGQWAVAYWGAIAFLVNKDLIPNVPQTWDDLLKPVPRG